MTSLLKDMRACLEEAYGIAEAADACARVGQIGRGVEIANSADDLILDAERLLGEATERARSSTPEQGDRDAPFAAEDQAPEPGKPTMRDAAHGTIRLLLHHARERLHRAVGIARAAEIRAATSSFGNGARLALEVEPVLNEVKHFINTASILNRLVGTLEEPEAG